MHTLYINTQRTNTFAYRGRIFKGLVAIRRNRYGRYLGKFDHIQCNYAFCIEISYFSICFDIGRGTRASLTTKKNPNWFLSL